MAKAKDPGVRVEFRYEHEDEEIKLVPVRQPFQLGVIRGIDLWEEANMRAVFATLNEETKAMGGQARRAGPSLGEGCGV